MSWTDFIQTTIILSLILLAIGWFINRMKTKQKTTPDVNLHPNTTRTSGSDSITKGI